MVSWPTPTNHKCAKRIHGEVVSFFPSKEAARVRFPLDAFNIKLRGRGQRGTVGSPEVAWVRFPLDAFKQLHATKNAMYSVLYINLFHFYLNNHRKDAPGCHSPHIRPR